MNLWNMESLIIIIVVRHIRQDVTPWAHVAGVERAKAKIRLGRHGQDVT